MTNCRRSNGTLRAWFHSREEAEAFEADPANVAYHGDVAHLCDKCGRWHLSRREWLAQPGDVLVMNGEPYRVLMRTDSGTLLERITEAEAEAAPPTWLTPRRTVN